MMVDCVASLPVVIGRALFKWANMHGRRRQAYKANKESLSPEERARAEMLLARDERKQQKKDERKHGQAHKPALREKRDEWRAYRREQAVARAAGP